MDQKTSLLINRQVPDFIRTEYPLFVNFLEAYYEFLETKQGVELNDLTTQSKNLRYVSDIDESIDQFASNFLNTYAALMPNDLIVDKALMIKHLLPLYLAKGTPKSFNLLFRILFGEEVTVSYPSDNVLKASASKWVVENALNVSTDIFSYYTGDGTTKTFYLLQEIDKTNISVYVNNVLLDSTQYIVSSLYRKLTFNSAPPIDSTIKVYYRGFDELLLNNRKITGLTSNASGIVEKVTSKIINNRKIYQLYVNQRTISGTFSLGENIVSDILVGNDLIDVSMTTISELHTIELVNRGSSYNVGDPVQITVASAERQPAAYVSKVASTTIDKITISNGGAGFQNNANIFLNGDSSYYPLVNIQIGYVYTESPNTANTLRVFSDTIDSINANTVYLSDVNFGLIRTANVNTNICFALSNTSYTDLGEITIVNLNQCLISFSKSPNFQAVPASYNFGSTPVYINEFGSLGKIIINDGGMNYANGDVLVFTNKPMSFGYGAEAEVIEVDNTGKILNVDFVPPKITGTATVSSLSSPVVTGIGTSFNTDLTVGQMIMINGETRNVAVLTSATKLNVDTNFTQTFSGKPIRSYDLGLVGGQGYTQDALPSVFVNSSSGTGANISVTAIFGDGEQLDGSLGDKKPGQIEEILIVDAGRGLHSLPIVNLRDYGDGTATANAVLYSSFESYPGKWVSRESFLSTNEYKLQGKDYYINYAYLLTSPIEFSKYKSLLKNLLHPAGYIYYSILTREEETTSTFFGVESNVSKQISGRVNVHVSSATVVGTNTKFNIANASGVLTIGDEIVVNTQIRTVDSIVDNTHITVTSAFANTSNNYVLTIL